MPIYRFIEFVHIVSVILWVGGGALLILKAIKAGWASDATELASVVEDTVFFTYRLFLPAAFVALICGLMMVVLAWSFSFVWVWIGLIGFAIVLAAGLLILKPRAERTMEVIRQTGASHEVLRMGREILRVANFNYIVLFIVVGDMVLKPTLSNAATLVGMAIIFSTAGILFLAPFALQVARMPDLGRLSDQDDRRVARNQDRL